MRAWPVGSGGAPYPPNIEGLDSELVLLEDEDDEDVAKLPMPGSLVLLLVLLLLLLLLSVAVVHDTREHGWCPSAAFS